NGNDGKLHYSNITLANADSAGWYPFRIQQTSSGFVVEKAINSTSFQTGFWSLFNCLYNKVKLGKGAVKLSCQDAVSLARHDLVWNPVSNQITEYDGSEGAYPAMGDATWVDSSPADSSNSSWGVWAQITNGSLFVLRTENNVVYFNNTTTIVTNSIGLVKALATFSN
ncbi:MAG: hypothetical protein ACAH17_02870, partial [Candidatus Paceibacterota bacterium]